MGKHYLCKDDCDKNDIVEVATEPKDENTVHGILPSPIAKLYEPNILTKEYIMEKLPDTKPLFDLLESGRACKRCGKCCEFIVAGNKYGCAMSKKEEDERVKAYHPYLETITIDEALSIEGINVTREVLIKYSPFRFICRCTALVHGKCSIYDERPEFCSVYPLQRMGTMNFLYNYDKDKVYVPKCGYNELADKLLARLKEPDAIEMNRIFEEENQPKIEEEKE